MRTCFALIVTAVFAVACSKEAPPPAALPVETAGDAMRRDNADIAKRLAEQKAEVESQGAAERERNERKARVDAFVALGTKWVSAAEATGKAGRGELGPHLEKLNALRSELGTLETDACTAKVRDAMSRAMGMTIDAFTQFKGETGPASDAVKQKVAEASAAFNEVDQVIRTCT